MKLGIELIKITGMDRREALNQKEIKRLSKTINRHAAFEVVRSSRVRQKK